MTKLRNLLEANPILVTGIGACSATGMGTSALFESAANGRASGEFRDYEIAGDTRSIAVCAAPPLDPGDPELHPVRRMDRAVQLAWVAARQALHSSGFELAADGSGVGVIVGSSRGSVGKLEEGFARTSARRYPPSLSADCTFASISGALAQAFAITGPSATISATCASGAFAIAFAAEQILLGNAEVMIVGGTEAPLVPAVIAQLDAAGVLGTHADPKQTCRPFDVTRNGLCLGEGSAFLVLESSASVARRGVRPLARLAGWGLSVDHSGRAGVSESGLGMLTAASKGMDAAQLTPAEIDYVNPHGTGTRLNDAAEARALHELLGARAGRVPCISTKPITGHCLGATPALEAVLCVEALIRQRIPRTTNCSQPDPDCVMSVPPCGGGPFGLRHVMSNSLGFWGYHASLIFSRVT